MSNINQTPARRESSSGDKDLRAVAEDATQRIKDGAGAALDGAKAVGSDLKQEAGKIAGEALEGAKSFAEENKGKVAGQIDSIATALNRAADELDGSEQAQFAGYARQLAGGVNQISSAVRDKGVEELLGMVGNFARSNTAAFIGGAALLGFAASRFAMAGIKSAAGANQSSDYPGYGAAESGQPLSGEPVVREPWNISDEATRPGGTAGSNGGNL